MTVLEKIRALNTAFQKSYYDEDLGFFSHVAPGMLQEMGNLICSIIPQEHDLRLTINPHLELVDYEIANMKEVSTKNITNESVKDNYLISAKRNASQACWRFRDALWRYNAKILEQVVA
jgi:hypothetical protein